MATRQEAVICTMFDSEKRHHSIARDRRVSVADIVDIVLDRMSAVELNALALLKEQEAQKSKRTTNQSPRNASRRSFATTSKLKKCSNWEIKNLENLSRTEVGEHIIRKAISIVEVDQVQFSMSWWAGEVRKTKVL
jgi:hypothetical protein